MKKSLKTFKKTALYNGYTVLIYGELWEEGYIDGLVVQRAKFSKDGNRVMDVSRDSEHILLNRPYTRTRYFNMGWAICSPDDKFDLATGIEICKRRFRKSPLKTETGLFLTKDMVNALINNELEYIAKHWDKFVPHKRNTELKSDVKKDEVKKETPKDVKKRIEEVKKRTVEPGMYVKINKQLSEDITEIGYVKGVGEDKVYLLWTVKFSDNFCSFKCSYGKKTFYAMKDNVKIATKEEIEKALDSIDKNTAFKWNDSAKKFEINYI